MIQCATGATASGRADTDNRLTCSFRRVRRAALKAGAALPRGLRRSAMMVRAEKSFDVDEALAKYKEISYKIPPIASAATLPVISLSLLCKLLTGAHPSSACTPAASRARRRCDWWWFTGVGCKRVAAVVRTRQALRPGIGAGETIRRIRTAAVCARRDTPLTRTSPCRSADPTDGVCA